MPDFWELSEEDHSPRRLKNKRVQEIASNPNARKFIRAMSRVRGARNSVLVTGDNKLKLLNDLQETQDPSFLFRQNQPNVQNVKVATLKENELLAPRRFQNVLNYNTK